VQLLADRLDLQQLISAYALAVDRHDRAAIAALFADDAILAVADSTSPSGQRIVVQGRDAIAEFIVELAQPGGAHFPGPTAHITGALVLVIEADTASGNSQCVAHHITNISGQMVHHTSYLRYQDGFVRRRGGWLIRTRVLHHDFQETRPVGDGSATGD
jgi:ketosteroid isomerase-like protein